MPDQHVSVGSHRPARNEEQEKKEVAVFMQSFFEAGKEENLATPMSFNSP